MNQAANRNLPLPLSSLLGTSASLPVCLSHFSDCCMEAVKGGRISLGSQLWSVMEEKAQTPWKHTAEPFALWAWEGPGSRESPNQDLGLVLQDQPLRGPLPELG